MLLLVMNAFVSMGESVAAFNRAVEKVVAVRDRIRENKDAMKEKFTENQQLLTSIQEIRTQQEEATKKLQDLKKAFE